ncbi:GNAT family N-acetyltransferase [Frigoribacterium faeni]|uniref:GNAT family N-acetyltransferase n=1 Tax=Frigoribacterium faeni TaxID=145483 RepID=UPI0024133943|nr:GNAT family N-acetyltransferase [Frigoribacterium faeni]
MSSHLRLIEPRDAPELARALTRNREFLAPWDPVRGDAYFTPEGQLSVISSLLAQRSRGEAQPFVIVDEGAVVGRLTLSGIARGPSRSCDLGYWLSEDRNGRGIMTSAVGEAVDWAFGDAGLHRVQAGTLRHNVASQRVLQKAGFEQYGIAPSYLEIAGRWQDHVLFQRVDDSTAT